MVQALGSLPFQNILGAAKGSGADIGSADEHGLLRLRFLLQLGAGLRDAG